MKVGREEIVGLITALKRYVAGSDEDDAARWSEVLRGIATVVGEVHGVKLSHRLNPAKPIPALVLDIDAAVAGFTAYDAALRLLSGDRPIAVGESRAEFGQLTINAQSLTDEEADYVGNRLHAVLSGGR
jgi:L-seryl-tRNA(Ser) seleniumtransferase